MKVRNSIAVAALACCVIAPPAAAGDLRSEMEADNARWLAAFNTPNPGAFAAMYAKDALLLPPGAQPVAGPEAIRQFWEGRIKAGVGAHTFEIVRVDDDGKHAYQVAKWSVVVTKDSGEKMPLTGNTLRIFERQNDGTWLTKVHMFTRH